MGDEAPGQLPGDVVFVIQEKDHDLFKRKGADLIMEKEISLRQALTGFKYPVKHLDGSILMVKSNPGEIIRPNTLKAVSDGGMPIHKRPFEFGRLFVFFKVKFPASLTKPQMQVIRSALPDMDCDDVDMSVLDKSNPDEVEQVSMIDMEASDFGKVAASANAGAAYDSDDEDGQGQQRVQCQQS